MALIKCDECGQMVSGKASACPNCGCPIEKRLVCEECGETIGVHDKLCPECGCPTQSPKLENTFTTDGVLPDNPQKTSKTLYYVVGIVGYIILATISSALLKTTYASYTEIGDRILGESLCCAGAACILICGVSKSLNEKILFSLLAVVLSLTCFSLWKEMMEGTAIIQFLSHLTLIIVSIIRR